MKLHRLLGLLLALASGMTSVSAAEIVREGSWLRVSGPLDLDSVKDFTEQLTASRAPRMVVLEDSTGGSVQAGAAYAGAIRSAGVNTEARGECQAACALAFLAGKEHRFGRGPGVHSLLIPLGTRTPPESTELQKILAGYVGSPPAAESWLPTQGLLFTATPTLFGRVYHSYWCDGSQGEDPSKCEPLSGVDPHQLGVISP